MTNPVPGRRTCRSISLGFHNKTTPAIVSLRAAKQALQRDEMGYQVVCALQGITGCSGTVWTKAETIALTAAIFDRP